MIPGLITQKYAFFNKQGMGYQRGSDISSFNKIGYLMQTLRVMLCNIIR